MLHYFSSTLFENEFTHKSELLPFAVMMWMKSFSQTYNQDEI